MIRRLLRLIETALGLADGFFAVKFDPPMVYLRPLRYSGERVGRRRVGAEAVGGCELSPVSPLSVTVSHSAARPPVQASGRSPRLACWELPRTATMAC